MTTAHCVIGLVSLCVLTCVAWAAGRGGSLLSADFEQDPTGAGWRGGAPRGAEFDGAWSMPAPGSAGRYLTVRTGHWQSPFLAVRPFAYYRLRFRAKARTDGYWAAIFFDAKGKELTADHYDSLPGSRAWQGREGCFRAPVDAARVGVRFVARRTPIAVDDVVVEEIARADAAAWADTIYAGIPPVGYRPPRTRGRLLPKALGRLADGPALRVVLLGDSIANDTSNSTFDVLLERVWPRCRVEVVNAVRGGTGCGYYKQPGRVRQYVLRHRPDLLIIAGISHGYDPDSIRSVVEQVRAGSDCEILLMTGCVCPEERCQTTFVESCGRPGDEACEILRAYPGRLAAFAAQAGIELLDMRRPWEAYVRGSGRPQPWFMRDPIHANVRGKQVLGRILLRYFAPPRKRPAAK
jgi:hypothetical protein